MKALKTKRTIDKKKEAEAMDALARTIKRKELSARWLHDWHVGIRCRRWLGGEVDEEAEAEHRKLWIENNHDGGASESRLNARYDIYHNA